MPDPVNQARERTPRDLEVKRREKRVVELRIEGYDFDAIAQECGYASRSGAYAAWKRALKAIPYEAVDEARTLALARLEALWRVAYPKALAGHGRSLDRCLHIMEREAHLLGLDLSDGKTIQQQQRVAIIEVPASRPSGAAAAVRKVV
jgi:hypothetical protein